MYVKICGLSDPATLAAALDAGADAVGFVCSPRSVRHVDEARARTLAAAAATVADRVLVVNDLPAAAAVDLARRIGVDVLQLHGPRYGAADVAAAASAFGRVWRAASLAEWDAAPVGAAGEEALLLDSPVPGSGRTWSWENLDAARPSGRWLLAGGLQPGNVAAAIAAALPHGVDVSSGVESAPGVKDPDLIRAFVAAAKAAVPTAADR